MPSQKKKNTWGQPTNRGFGTKRLAPELQKAEGLLRHEKWEEAIDVLANLDQIYPENPEVLTLLMVAYLEMSDMPKHIETCERLLKADPRNADAAYGIAAGYLQTMHPLLALQAGEYAIQRFPNHELAATIQEVISEIADQIDDILADIDLSGEKGRELAMLHERGQAYLERRDFDRARAAELELLQHKPDFMPALNNLSLISFSQDRTEEAIAYTQQVLDQQPDNVHALANLIRFSIVQGQLDRARTYGEQLKASQSSAWDILTKKAEGLSYLGDDAGVIQLFEQATSEEIAIANPLFHHFVAVALARTGQVEAAREQWYAASELQENMAIIEENLADLDRPIGSRNGAWAFQTADVLGLSTVVEMLKLVEAITVQESDEVAVQLVADHASAHPNFIAALSVLLNQGDPLARELACNLLTDLDFPEALSVLQEFALGQQGTDQLRYRAALAVSDAGLFEEQTIPMWMDGAQQEMPLFQYELTDEPPVHNSPKVEKLIQKAANLILQRDRSSFAQVETILRSALELEPDAANLRVQLAATYQAQGKTADAADLIRQVAADSPDYAFAQLGLANLHLELGELEAAEAILKPLLSRKQFHFNEFAQFSKLYVDLLWTKGEKKAARAWLKAWQNVDPENPLLASSLKLYNKLEAK
jgi:tetratricopeptide (TPR) repeat protein